MEDVRAGLPPPAFRERQVEADGFQIRYLESGQEDYVVLLDANSWGIWDLHNALARKHHVIALELPGFGASSQNGSSRSASDMAGTVAQALSRIAPGGYTLIGTSFGANVALWHALQAPALIDALILVSPTCLMPDSSYASATREEKVRRLLAHPERLPDFPNVDPSTVDKELALVQHLGGYAHDEEAEARLSEIECATLIVFGSEDRLVSQKAPSIYREKIPGSNLSVVYNAGHAIVAERPDALIDPVVDYVRRRETYVVNTESRLVYP